MSRSYRTFVAGGICVCQSEKRDKRAWHRQWRRRQRNSLRLAQLTEAWETIPSNIREICNVYAFGKDGKSWYYESSWRRRTAFLRFPCVRGNTFLTRVQARKALAK